jgi:hypothetical protein
MASFVVWSMLQYVTSYLLELPKGWDINTTFPDYIKDQHQRPLVTAHDLFDPWESELVHFHSQLKQVVQTLTLGLCLGRVVTPDIAAGSGALALGYLL